MRIRLGTFQLRDSAESWWRSIRDSRDISGMTWETFCQLFLERHFPSVIRDRKNLEFIILIQGGMSVSEYEVRFTALSRFAPEMVREEERRCRRFEGGLNLSIRSYVVARGHTVYERCVDSALRMGGENTSCLSV